jgi:hypothetical protein
MICVKNKRYQASLEVRKIYETIADPSAAAHQLVRVIDESGEDYLYPKDYFVPLELPSAVKRALVRA